MPSCSKQTNPRGIEILFEEASHKYSSVVNGNELVYISGTTFVSRFFPKFDPTGEIARKSAIKEGVTTEEIQRRWKAKGQSASRFGTKIHETMEDVLLGNTLRNKPENDRERNTMDKAVKLAKILLNSVDILGVEKIVFDDGIRIAGTVDLLARSKKNGRVMILDYKTNERIDTFNRFNKFALPPIETIADTNYSHYALQLNLYENIMKRAGYVEPNESVDKAIFHITEAGNQPYQLPNLQREIELMIRQYMTENSIPY